MRGDGREGDADDAACPASVQVPIASPPVLWWRLRLGGAALPVVLLVMQDTAPVVVYALGFGTCAAVFILGSRLASLEVRIRRAHAARGRR